jgi:pyruvate formate lyase activating enzyme
MRDKLQEGRTKKKNMLKFSFLNKSIGVEAMFYRKLEGNLVQCYLCSHRCRIVEGKRGVCGVRENRGGSLYSLVYGKLVSSHVDPIEKKPLFHFLPGSSAYSIATVGCNFRCKNCQNWATSQSPKPQNPIMGRDVPPEEIVEAAKRMSCETIAYTYTEPVIFMEYAHDTARLALEADIKNVFVTNGYVTHEALMEIAPYLHAANIDLNSCRDEFYKDNCGARLNPILDSIKLHKQLGIWIEVTTLIIPTLNDSAENLTEIAEFIAALGVDIPWHISRFFPAYELTDLPPTPIETMSQAREIGLRAGLRYVYQGNVPGVGENTYCYNCGELLIERYGYRIVKNRIVESRCPRCGVEIDGVWT